MFQIISMIAAFQALFFSVLILTKKNKSMLDKHLSIWLIALTINILCISLSQTNNLPYSNVFMYPGYILAGLHGFFLYVCTKSLVNTSYKDFNKEHFIIGGYVLLALTGLLLYGSHSETLTLITRIFAFCFNALFIIFAVKLFHKYKSYLQTNFSTIDRLSFTWMKFLAFGLIFLLGGALLLVILHDLFSFQFSLYHLFALFVVLFVNILGFRGIKHSTIFNQTVIPYNELQPEVLNSIHKETSYDNYGLKQEDAVSLSRKLKNYMEVEKPYTNPDLNLKDLATALETYTHYITQILNTVFHQNFYDFVNTYRTEEAQKRLTDSRFNNLTILAIAYECGFNSKSTFNRIFKQKTGITPSEYRKQ